MLVVAALKVAVTPAGTPVAFSDTVLLELLRPETLMVVATLPLTGRVRLVAEEEMPNDGFEMVSAMVVVFAVPPQVPCTVAVYVPGIAVLLAANVTVSWPLAAAEGNTAVTPAGNPVALSAMLGEELLSPATVILLV